MNLHELASRYLDGTATEKEVAALDAHLRESTEARREFAALANLDAALAELAAGAENEAPAQAAMETNTTGTASPRSAMEQPWLALAACIALLFAGAVGWQWLFASYATVARGMGAEAFAPGMRIRGQTYELTMGTVEFVTARGAQVVIEAPASFQFESAQKLRLRHGRVAADVPPSAKGFTVITPTGQAVDLGTKFGVDVPAQGGEAEIHVFQGEVIARPNHGGGSRSLTDGQAYTLNRQASEARDLRSAAFIRPDETPALQAALSLGQQARAEAALAALRNDPALIALLDFEQEPLPEGTFRMTQGRWPGSRAPEFIHVGDHMKLNDGKDRSWPQLTLAAWVRLDRLGAPYQSLYHTDGWDENKSGQVHWMINRDSTMRLALKHNTLAPGSAEKQGFPDSAQPVLPEQGRWAHLAVVYDSREGTVRFYLNGRFDKETRQAEAHPALLGPAQIGNWNSKDRKLSGRIDEFFLLGRSMSDEEIHALYEAGNPYR